MEHTVISLEFGPEFQISIVEGFIVSEKQTPIKESVAIFVTCKLNNHTKKRNLEAKYQ